MTKITRFQTEKAFIPRVSIECAEVQINGIIKIIPVKKLQRIREDFPNVIGKKSSTMLIKKPALRELEIDGVIGIVKRLCEDENGGLVFVNDDGVIINTTAPFTHYLYIEHKHKKDYESNIEALNLYLDATHNKIISNLCGKFEFNTKPQKSKTPAVQITCPNSNDKDNRPIIETPIKEPVESSPSRYN